MILSPDQKRALSTLADGNPAVLGALLGVAARQSRSLAAHARSLSSTTSGRSQLPYFSPVLPVMMAEAAGAHVTDADGHRYVDCHMGYTASVLGHNPPAVVEGLRAAIGRKPGPGYFVEEQIELAELISRMVPHAERVTFLHSGADAVAAAERLMRAARRTPLIAKFEGCYHGWHPSGMMNTAATWAGKAGVDPLDAIQPRPNTGGLSEASASEYLVLPYGDPVALEQIERHAARLAGVVLDPLPRFCMDQPALAERFTREVRALTERLGVPLAFDEIVTGFRLAPGGASGAWGLRPDLACYGKITSGLGLPLSALAGGAALMDQARTEGMVTDYVANKVWISTTTAANTLAVTAALLQLRPLESQHAALFGALDRAHAALRQQVEALARQLDLPLVLEGHPRLYSMLSFRGPAPAPTGNPARDWFSAHTPRLLRQARLLALYLRPHGVYMETLPTTDLSVAHSAADVAQISAGLGNALRQMQQHGVFRP